MPSLNRIFGRQYPITVPPEFADETALLKYLGMSAKELKKIWWYRRRMYHEFSISKGRGKTRLIRAPDRRLKIIQQKLAPSLDKIYRRRNPVHGFVIDRSVKTNAEAHGSRRYVVNLDLQDFFPSITENRIKGLLRSLGINERVSEIVARLTCYEAFLPQGAPTSPVLLNMICYRLDTELLRVAKVARAIYTRYADDITFSAYQPPSPLFENGLPPVGKFSPELFSPNLRNVIEGNGFIINAQKAHYADRNSRRIVTGVKINDGLNVDRRYVRKIRAMLHSIERSGLKQAEARYSASGGKGSIEAHVRGKIAYVAHLKGAVDPVIRSLATRFNRSFPERTIKVVPTTEEMRDRAIWIVDHEYDGGKQGTAFFLKGVGLVTAAHCMENAVNPVVYHRTSSSNTWPVAVAKICK
ncbi:reverse transcriptase domain-containing protein [Aminobacter sp. LjRoot7]|uniref:reverse transcriptase domain-containing protein n=1 Tax=Aminobacter sp. LjRoot7 TaxID=3342335 RepID=UPI003ECF673B